MMIEMPPLQFAQMNGIRMGYYEAGPNTDKPPVILCHGWPEIAFSWRHQIKALSEAGIRVIAPDQRGYGATDRPEPVEAYDMEHLTGDLVGLLDHLKIDKAIFVGHDWGGFIVWQMPLRHHRPRRRRRRRQHAALRTARRPIRSSCFASASATACISCSSRTRRASPTGFSAAGSSRPLTPSCASRCRAADDAGGGRPIAGVGASPRLNLAFPQMIAGYDAKHDPRTPILSPEEKKVFVDTFTKTGFTGGINWYRNLSRNWQRSEGLDHTVRVPSLMIMAENDACCRHRPPTAWRRSSPIWRNTWSAAAAIGRSRKSRTRSAPS